MISLERQKNFHVQAIRGEFIFIIILIIYCSPHTGTSVTVSGTACYLRKRTGLYMYNKKGYLQTSD